MLPLVLTNPLHAMNHLSTFCRGLLEPAVGLPNRVDAVDLFLYFRSETYD